MVYIKRRRRRLLLGLAGRRGRRPAVVGLLIHDAGAVAVKIARQISQDSFLAAKGGFPKGGCALGWVMQCTGDRRPIKELAAWKWSESRLCSESPGFRKGLPRSDGTG